MSWLVWSVKVLLDMLYSMWLVSDDSIISNVNIIVIIMIIQLQF